MNVKPADEVTLVRVTTDDGERQIWLVATPREEVLDRVLDAIPLGWTVSLVERRLSAEHAVALNMAPGEVRQHEIC